jgi:hypothetical protein
MDGGLDPFSSSCSGVREFLLPTECKFAYSFTMMSRFGWSLGVVGGIVDRVEYSPTWLDVRHDVLELFLVSNQKGARQIGVK